MAEQNFANRTLYHGDNLDFLRGMNSETVDLIATDPPFNKNKDFHATPDSLAAGASFKDRWRWTKDVHEEWVDAIKDNWPGLWAVIESARVAYGQDMAAFICWLSVRVLEMHRILKPTGSMYLHIDHTAHAYAKAMMDAIFGRKHFRNEIVWKSRQDKGNLATKQMVRAHDIILWYVKSDQAKYNIQFLPYDDDYIKEFYRHQDSRGLYRLLPCTNETGGNKVYDFRGVSRAWRFRESTMQKMYKDNLLVQASPSSPWQYKKYLDDAKGIKLEDLWNDIPGARGNESTGFRTQKPLGLLRRIIKASAPPRGIVLDPFAGCATTLVAAELLGHPWVGMDIWDGALDVVKQRMENSRQLLTGIPEIKYETTPPPRTDADEIPVPNLRLHIQRPKEPWERLTNREIRVILEKAQELDGLIGCAGCGRVLERAFMELDHIQPKAENGADHLLNRILLCGPCNGRKSNQLTMAGLKTQNVRDGWMKDRAIAETCQQRALLRGTYVRDNWDAGAAHYL